MSLFQGSYDELQRFFFFLVLIPTIFISCVILLNANENVKLIMKKLMMWLESQSVSSIYLPELCVHDSAVATSTQWVAHRHELRAQAGICL
jgi:hypothetical protein